MSRNLEVGGIYIADIYPPKEKRCICVNLSPDLFLLVNTLNRKNYDCIPILQRDHSFLGMDRWIECADAFDLSSVNISDRISFLTFDEIVLIHKKIKENKKMKKSVKTKILNSLDELLDDYR